MNNYFITFVNDDVAQVQAEYYITDDNNHLVFYVFGVGEDEVEFECCWCKVKFVRKVK
jgi:hypothetical protein